MPLSTEISPTPELQTQQLQEDTLQAPRADFSLLSPSARTSFTRVDVCAENDQEGAAANRQAPLTDTSDVQTEGESQAVPQTPQTSLTFLLVSGRRRTMQFDPETTIGRAKELVWNAWPNEWQDERPPAPSYLRILYLGKILQDEDTLTKVGFPAHIPPSNNGHTSETSSGPLASTIVHLSIRSCAPPGSKDTPKKKSMRRNSAVEGEAERPAGCCSGCVVC